MPDKTESIRVAALVSYFPSLSQTFVALQLAALSKIPGCQLEIYSFGPPGEKSWLPKGTEFLADEVPVHYFQQRVKSVSKLRRYLAAFKNNPLSFIRYLFNSNKPEKLKTLVNDTYFLEPAQDADIVLCQFATIANKLVHYQKHQLWHAQGHLACAVRGFDISRKDLKVGIHWPDMFSQVALFLPVCDYFSRQLVELGCPAKISLCPSPINTPLLQDKPDRQVDDSRLQLLSVGRLVEKKGIDVALVACQKFKAAGQEFTYHIIGEGPLLEDLKAQSGNLGLDSHVVFHGAVPSDRVMAFYRQVDLMLVPSKTARNGDSEGIPNVIKEAMAAGVPVVSTRHSGIPEIVLHEQTGYLCDEDDADSLYQALDTALVNRVALPEIVERARQKVLTDFDPDRCAAKLFQDFVELMSEQAK